MDRRPLLTRPPWLAHVAVLALATAVAPMAVHGAKAPAPAQPSARTVIANYVKATGGLEAHKSVKNRVTQGVVSIPAAGIEGTFTTYEAVPNQRCVVMSLGPIGTAMEGTNGKVAWEIQPMQGPAIKQGEDLARVLRQAAFDPALSWEQLYKTAECTGRDTVAGSPAYRVVMTSASGEPETWYFDVKTGLLVRVISVAPGPQGAVQVQNDLEDYRAVGGMQIPFQATQTVMGAAFKLVIKDAQHNVEMEPGRFDPPQAVQDLLAAGRDSTVADTLKKSGR